MHFRSGGSSVGEVEATPRAVERQRCVGTNAVGQQLPCQGRTLQEFAQSKRRWMVRIQGGVATTPQCISGGCSPAPRPITDTSPFLCINRIEKVLALPQGVTGVAVCLFPELGEADCIGDEAECYPDCSFGVPDWCGGFEEAPYTNQDAYQVNEEPTYGPTAG